jgi:hypothetical protein
MADGSDAVLAGGKGGREGREGSCAWAVTLKPTQLMAA